MSFSSKISKLGKAFIFSCIFIICSACKNINLLHIADTSKSASGENFDTDFIKNSKRNCGILAKYSSPNDFFEIIPATEKSYYAYDIKKIRSRKNSREKCKSFFLPDNLEDISNSPTFQGEYSTDACAVFDRAETVVGLTQNDDINGTLIIYQIQVDDNLNRRQYCYEKAENFAKFLREINGVMIAVGSEDLLSDRHTKELFKAFENHRDIVKFYSHIDIEDEVKREIYRLRNQ